MIANFENSAVATGMEKVSLNSNPKECSNCCTIALISHASQVMLKILQARLQQYMNHELLGIQAVFRKGRGNISFNPLLLDCDLLLQKQEVLILASFSIFC